MSLFFLHLYLTYQLPPSPLCLLVCVLLTPSKVQTEPDVDFQSRLSSHWGFLKSPEVDVDAVRSLLEPKVVSSPSLPVPDPLLLFSSCPLQVPSFLLPSSSSPSSSTSPPLSLHPSVSCSCSWFASLPLPPTSCLIQRSRSPSLSLPSPNVSPLSSSSGWQRHTCAMAISSPSSTPTRRRFSLAPCATTLPFLLQSPTLRSPFSAGQLHL